MKAGQLAKWLNIGRSTITSWTNGDYQAFFSPGARGGSGQDRHFNEIDVRIMRFIAESRRRNVPVEEIVVALQGMQANDWAGLPPMPDAPPAAEFPVVPAAAADAQIDAERRAFLREITMLQQRVEQLERQIREEQAARRDEIERLLREREEMRARLAAAETELRLWQQGRLRPLDEK